MTTAVPYGLCGEGDVGFGGEGGPYDVKADLAGNIYEALDHCVRKMDPGGTVTTVAGNGGYVATGHYAPVNGPGGPSGAAEFAGLWGIAIDATGNIFTAEGSGWIRKIDSDGNVTALAGNGMSGFVDGPGASAEFETPDALVVDAAGNVYVAELDGNRIRKVDPSGNVTTLAGNGTAGSHDGTGGTQRHRRI